MKRVLWLMAPLIFGQAITEVNILVGAYFAWTIPGAVSYLFYANRIVQFPLGVFGIAIATAAFPRLSRDAIGQEDSRKAVADTVIYALGKILFIMLPSAAGIAILGRDIFGAILNRGAFLREGSLEPTYLCALAYCAGLPFFASVKIIVSAFYARQNTRTPTLGGLLTVLCNLTLVILLRKPLGAAGLALATTLSSCLSFFVLTRILRGRLQVPLFLPLGGYFLRSALSALIMSAGLWAAGFLLPAAENRFLLYLLRLGILLPLGMGLYGAGQLVDSTRRSPRHLESPFAAAVKEIAAVFTTENTESEFTGMPGFSFRGAKARHAPLIPLPPW
jgi:putative peptidoglycan lipid II flippase